MSATEAPHYTREQQAEAFEYLRELALAPNADPRLACALFSWGRAATTPEPERDD